MIETDNNARYTVQGRKVAEHWSRMAVTYEGALKTLKPIIPKVRSQC